MLYETQWRIVQFATVVLITLAAFGVCVGLCLLCRDCACESEADGSSMPAADPAVVEAEQLEEREQIMAEVMRRPALPPQPDPVRLIAAQVIALQPWYAEREDDALDLASEIHSAAAQYDLDPRLLVALGMRESSLLDGRTGSRGEKGRYQIMPHGAAARQCGPEGDAYDAACWLAKCREWCPGPTERWLAAYGMSRCPSAEEARRDPTVRRAMRWM